LGFGTVNIDVKDFAFLAGPRINFHPVFVHALVGVDHLSGSALGYSASQNSFGGAFGGGFEVPVSSRWGIRLSADYVLTNHNIFGGPGTSYTQNNYRASAGIVFKFEGGIERSTRSASREMPRMSATEQAPLFGVSGHGVSQGFYVTSVTANSPAERAGMNPGNVLTTIDGQPVHTSKDIENAIATSATGTVKVTYLIEGAWLADRDVKVH
jgi:membrane-associated protease RseP (regulator of RpoE activity)